MKLRDLAKLDEQQLAQAVRDLIGTVDGQDQTRAILQAELAQFEKKYGKSSEEYLSAVACEQREADPEINRWATIFECYRDLMSQVQFA